MKKKNIEKLAERRKVHTEVLEIILNRRNREIAELKEQLEGRKQVENVLKAFILEGIAKEGEIRIPIKGLSEGLKTGYTLEVTETEYILKKDS